ncbi:methylated-DNA--[protein]-cysteine S-methyltransferase [Hymenobacter humi]
MIGSRSTLDTPFGPFTTVVDADGVVLAAGWTTEPEVRLLPLIHASLMPAEVVERDDLGEVTAAVRSWLAGDPAAAATVPVRQHGGVFMQELWARMREIPAGSPVSYAELATLAGRPLAPRGAGQACQTNAIGLFVPDHRVRKGDGSLGGYRWGIEVKAKLLEMEANWP